MNTALTALDPASIARASDRARLRGLAQECRNVAALFAADGAHGLAGDCLSMARDLETQARALGGEL